MVGTANPVFYISMVIQTPGENYDVIYYSVIVATHLETEFTNSFPWSDIILFGHPCRQNTEKRKSATPIAVLSLRAPASGHFEK